MKFKSLAAAAAMTLMGATASQAAVIVLDFEGVGNLNEVGNFYNGGAGTNYGIQFGAGSLALVDSDVGGSGNTGNEPSGQTVLVYLTSASAMMNVAAGFTTGFSFFYSSTSFAGSVSVYDGLDGTGNLLASLNLPALGVGPGDPSGSYSNWDAVGVTFAGLAKSVSFGGVANFIVFDNITIGSSTPVGAVPVPASLPLLLAGVGGIAALRRRKKA